MQKHADLSEKEAEMLADIAEGRFTNFYLLSKGQKFVAYRLQEKGLIITGGRDHHVPMCLTERGKKRFGLAR